MLPKSMQAGAKPKKVILRVGFQLWQHHSRVLRMSRSAQDAAITKWCSALAMWELHLCRRMMRQWHGLAPTLHALAAYTRLTSTLFHQFQQWHGVVRWRWQQLLQAAVHYEGTKLSRSFYVWQESAREFQQLTLADTHARQRLLLSVLLTLQSTAASMRQACEAASKHVGRRRKAWALALWHSAAARAARRWESEVAVSRLCHVQQGGDILRAWQTGTAAAIDMRLQLERALKCWRSRVVSAALRGWRVRVKLWIQKHERAQVRVHKRLDAFVVLHWVELFRLWPWHLSNGQRSSLRCLCAVAGLARPSCTTVVTSSLVNQLL